MSGKFKDALSEFYVIDCRYLYEFEGGHVKDALNFTDVNQLCSYFFNRKPLRQSKHVALLFHCEFSSHRAPKM